MLEELIFKYYIVINHLIGLGPMAGFLLIVLESIIPILPLGVFIAINVEAFGVIVAYLISYLATCLGCYLSYLVFRQYLSAWYEKKVAKSAKLKRASKKIKKIKLSNLVLILALPFTPASLINALCGINKVGQRKFITAIIIAKIFTIGFWVFIGKNLSESFRDPKIIITVAFMLCLAYLISRIVSRKMEFE